MRFTRFRLRTAFLLLGYIALLIAIAADYVTSGGAQQLNVALLERIAGDSPTQYGETVSKVSVWYDNDLKWNESEHRFQLRLLSFEDGRPPQLQPELPQPKFIPERMIGVIESVEWIDGELTLLGNFDYWFVRDHPTTARGENVTIPIEFVDNAYVKRGNYKNSDDFSVRRSGYRVSSSKLNSGVKLNRDLEFGLTETLRSNLSQQKTAHNNTMHAKPDMRVFLKWMIAGSGSVITDVMSLNKRNTNFNYKRLAKAIAIRDRSYKLLMWISDAIDKGHIQPSRAAHQSGGPNAATEWLRTNYFNIPEELRPPENDIKEFAAFFSTYLTSSFDVTEKPGTKGEGPTPTFCRCELCMRIVNAPHLRAKKLYSRDKRRAVSLMRQCLNELATKNGLDLAIDQAEHPDKSRNETISCFPSIRTLADSASCGRFGWSSNFGTLAVDCMGSAWWY